MILLPAKLSVNTFTAGIPPATAASNFKETLFFSASSASSCPCFANSALFAVITCFPDLSAVSIASLAGFPSPPISSTKTSISLRPANSIISLSQLRPSKLTPRSFDLDLAEIALSSTDLPLRDVINLECECKILTTPAPTVPKPAMPIFKALPIKFSLFF